MIKKCPTCGGKLVFKHKTEFTQVYKCETKFCKFIFEEAIPFEDRNIHEKLNIIYELLKEINLE